MRLFYAIFPPPQVVSALEAAQRALAAIGTGRLVRRERLHLTLCFLGERDEAGLHAAGELLKRAGQEAIGLRLGGMGRFGSTVVVRVDGGEPLVRLARALGAGADFAPHITLARNDRGAGEEALRIEIPAVAWVAQEVVLVQSLLGREARYVIRRAVRLGGADR